MKCKVTVHAEREGRDDYTGRAQDVAFGSEPEAWCWPYRGADEAYINAVGIEGILSATGTQDWSTVNDAWCDAFKRGYVDAALEDGRHYHSPLK